MKFSSFYAIRVRPSALCVGSYWLFPSSTDVEGFSLARRNEYIWIRVAMYPQHQAEHKERICKAAITVSVTSLISAPDKDV